MSLRVDRLALRAALAKVKPVIRTGPVEILRRVLLSSRPDPSVLTISATDLQCSVSVEVACQEGAEALEVVVDHGRLAEACSSDWAESLEVGIGVDGRLDVVGGVRTRLACYPVDAFPTILPPPEDGEWTGMGAEVIESIRRCAPWCEGEIEKGHVPVQAKFVWVFGTEVGKEPALGIFGARDHAALYLYVPGPVPAGLGCLALGKDAAQLVGVLGDGEGIEVLDVEGKHYFRGEGWWASEAKGETGGADVRRFVDNPAMRGDGMRPLTATGDLLRVLGSAPRRLTRPGGGGAALLKIVPASPSGSRCYLEGDEITWSGEVAADLPAFRTYEIESLVDALKELDLSAGTDGVIEAGTFQGGNLRLEVEGRALALLSGVRE